MPTSAHPDRRHSGNTPTESSHRRSAPVKLDGGVLRLRVIVDKCSVEVFPKAACCPERSGLPGVRNLGTEVSVEGGTAVVRKLAVTALSYDSPSGR
ncbi:GH32 C-terminal domain-containing protein [Pseudarthrobacter oxydans]|uniref:GH32 C-terminal domain-containing protein n=1 Tax=Pseudarthrobacter oxydans TaxID=1671 RepID=UPI003F4FCF4F